ncbi:MAG: outer membrane protein assembly factor BamB family protein [Planctomycetota bacterium]|jgi:outer membrane protein assembly factor BamB
MTSTWHNRGHTCLLTFSSLILALCAGAPCLADGEKAKTGNWLMWGGSRDRNMVSDAKGIPSEWDVKAKKYIKWVAPLGSQTYGNPVITHGKVLVGTNNNGNLRPEIKGDKGVIVCLDEKTGKFLWQLTHDKMPTGRVNDWPEQGICSAPYVDGDRIYYVSNRCELVCADINGFLDGKNDGPYQEEKYKEKQDGDIIWLLDMFTELDAFPHNLATCSPVGYGDLIFVATSNGVDEGHLNLPEPDAPDFMAVDKNTGKIVWQKSDPGGNVLHGGWSSPRRASCCGNSI